MEGIWFLTIVLSAPDLTISLYKDYDLLPNTPPPMCVWHGACRGGVRRS